MGLGPSLFTSALNPGLSAEDFPGPLRRPPRIVSVVDLRNFQLSCLVPLALLHSVVRRSHPGYPGAPATSSNPRFKEIYAHARHCHTAWARRSAVSGSGTFAHSA